MGETVCQLRCWKQFHQPRTGTLPSRCTSRILLLIRLMLDDAVELTLEQSVSVETLRAVGGFLPQDGFGVAFHAAEADRVRLSLARLQNAEVTERLAIMLATDDLQLKDELIQLRRLGLASFDLIHLEAIRAFREDLVAGTDLGEIAFDTWAHCLLRACAIGCAVLASR